MAPIFMVRFTTNSSLQLLVALIHKAIAPQISLEDDGSTLYTMGWHQFDDGSVEPALATFQKLLIGAQQINDGAKMEMALNGIGFIYQNCELQQAAEAQIRTPAEIEDFESPSTPEALLGIANHYHVTANYEQALTYYERALYQATRLQRITQMGLCLNGMGLIYRKLQNYERSHTYSQAAVEMFTESGDRTYRAAALHNLGITCYRLQRHGQALHHFEQALSLRNSLKDLLGESMTLACMGQVYVHRQEFLFALGCYQAALEACREFGQQVNVVQEESILLGQIARVCEHTNHKDLAINYYLEALEKLQHDETSYGTAMILNRLGRLHEGLGHHAIALHYYHEALGKCKTSTNLSEDFNYADFIQGE